MVDSKRNSFPGYTKVITDLPEADIPFEGMKGWILQGQNHQLAFMQTEPKAGTIEHSHEYAEWGMIIEGEMEMTIEGKTRTLSKGDEFLIPARAKHKLVSLAKSRGIILFSERTRYQTKPVSHSR